MRFRALLSAAALAALAACGSGDGTDEGTAEPFDSAAPAPGTAAAPEESVDRAGAIDAVNQRLEQAERDAAARDADAAEQLRRAGGAGADSL